MDPAGKDKELPWLPEQHDEQLQLGYRIIQNAFNSKVKQLEQDIRALRHTNEEKTALVQTLQKKNSQFEVELIESHQRQQQLKEENGELFKTVAQLKKQITRLEELKKRVVSSLQDEQTMENDDAHGRLYMSDDYLRGAAPLTAASVEGTFHSNTAASPARGASPGGSTSSPGGAVGGSKEVDGKKFFKTARARLSYESFNAFLANIKKLNNNTQTREQTLREAKNIFGFDNDDLFADFQVLLDRHA